MTPGYLIVVDTIVDDDAGALDPEEWSAQHAEQLSRIPGVTRVERYWSVGEGEQSHHLALFHVTEAPAVMAQRFAQAKDEGRLTGSPFAARTQRAYRLHAVVAD